MGGNGAVRASLGPNRPPILGAEASTGLLALKVESGSRVQAGPESQASLTPAGRQEERGICWVTHCGWESPLFALAAGWLDAAGGPRSGRGGHPACAGPQRAGFGLRSGSAASRVPRGQWLPSDAEDRTKKQER